MSHLGTLTHRRALGGLVAACLPVALLTIGSPPAHAEEIGGLVLIPSTGHQDTLLDLDTLVECPDTASTLRVDLIGPGIAENNGIMMANTSISPALTPSNDVGGYHLNVSDQFGDVFVNNNITTPTGVYTLSVLCFDESGFFGQGEINGQIEFTPTTGSFHATYAQLSTGEDTTTSLTTSPLDPRAAGEPTTLTATVTPAAASGTVQFRRGDVALGTPVDVMSGVATTSVVLPTGSSELKAEFVPDDPTSYNGSTSAAAAYLVVAAPTLSGTAQAGRILTCSAPPTDGQTFAWLVNGAVAGGFSSKNVTVPASWVGKQAACRLTTEKAGRQLVQPSSGRKVALGAALRATTPPAVTGRAKVGQTLRCSSGAWSPTASSYRYLWLRDGKAIGRATKPTYKVVKTDRRHKLSCRVTAAKPGFASGKATSKPKVVG